MNQQEKVFFERLNTLLNKREMEQMLTDNPMFEDQLSDLGYDVISRNSDLLKDYRKRGLIVRRPYPTLQEFVTDNKSDGYVVLQSTINQMTSEEYRQVRQSGLLNKGIKIYNDVEGEVVHFNFMRKEFNGSYASRSTGGNQMIRVRMVNLDEQESDARVNEIRNAQLNYDKAQKEIQWLLTNLESLVEGNYNTQYHDDRGLIS